jgi:hypothetical protein
VAINQIDGQYALDCWLDAEAYKDADFTDYSDLELSLSNMRSD